MNVKLILLSILVFSSLSVLAQVPKYSNEFLAIGVGAKALGMSSSVVAGTDDVTSGYWNPAGLTNMTSDKQIGLMHAEYFAGIAKYDYLSYAMFLDTMSSFGVSLIRFGIDDIPNTLELYDNNGNIDYSRISKFSAADYAIFFHYARKLNIPDLSVGGNVKIIYRHVGDFANAYGFGLDAAIQYRPGKWQFGAILRDLTSTFNAWTFNVTDEMIEVYEATGNEIPSNSVEITMPRLIVGAGRHFDISDNFSSTVETDLDITFDGKRNTLIKTDAVSADPRVGVEFGFKDFAFIRAGVGNFQQETQFGGNKTMTVQPNFGVGFVIKKMVSIDYAFTDIGNASIALYSNIFSVRVDLGKN